jgi:hypothetical protein
MKKIGGTTVEWGDNGGAANPAAPELLRMQMEKLTNRRKKAMKKTDKEDAVRYHILLLFLAPKLILNYN